MGLFKEVKKPLIRKRGGGQRDQPAASSFCPKAPPCASGCPNGNEIRELLVINRASQRLWADPRAGFERVWKQIVERNPFPAVTGRICPHPCETACNRAARMGRWRSMRSNARSAILGLPTS